MVKLFFRKNIAQRICNGEVEGKIITIDDEPVEVLKWNINNKIGSVVINIKHKYGDEVVIVNDNGQYNINGVLYQLYILINDYNEFKFKPFDKVLVRDSIQQKWSINIFNRSYLDKDGYNKYECLTDVFNQCIPYEGNESLHDTSKMYEKN